MITQIRDEGRNPYREVMISALHASRLSRRREFARLICGYNAKRTKVCLWMPNVYTIHIILSPGSLDDVRRYPCSPGDNFIIELAGVNS